MCIEKDCTNSSLYAYEKDNIPFLCSVHKKKGMVLKDYYYCLSCAERATHGHVIAKYCELHKEEGMMKIHSRASIPISMQKRCSLCTNNAYWNYPSGSHGVRCAFHKKVNMVDFNRLHCNHRNGCVKIPCYYSTKSNFVYCEDHRNEHMVQIEKVGCTFKGCSNNANCKLGIYKMPMFCEEHAQSNYYKINISSCSVDGCNGVAFFKKEYSTNGAEFCLMHKQSNMRLANKKFLCKTRDCTEEVAYGFEGSVASKCLAHKAEGMIYMSRKCQAPTCNRKASYNYKNNDKPIYCVDHKLGNMTSKYSS